MMHKWIIFSVGGAGVAARISEIFFYKESAKWFFIKNPNLIKILAGGRGGGGGVATVSVFFQKNPSLNFFSEGVKVREDWLV